MIILAKTFALLDWLLRRVDTFPRSGRQAVTPRLTGAALDLQEALHQANARAGAQRMSHLEAADAHLDNVRLYLRLAHQWQWLSDGQYRHVSLMVAEVGRLLGGWKKQSAGR